MSSTKESRNKLKPPTKERVYSTKYSAVYARKWREEHPNGCSMTCCLQPVTFGSLCDHHKSLHYETQRRKDSDRKLRVLTHYGPCGALQCSWVGCEINDPDMLSIDHVNNDGAADRRVGYEGCGNGLYRRLERDDYPDGYQTLCHNHQWKKECIRRRAQRKGNNTCPKH